MLSRPQLCSLRERTRELTAPAAIDRGMAELGAITLQLVNSLEQMAASEARLRVTIAELVAACRASVAAARLGAADPLVHIEHQLDAHGWTPAPDARPAALLAAITELRPLLVPAAAA